MPYEATLAISPSSTARQRSATSASTQPPETEPYIRPERVTASFEPRGRGALRRVATTVAIATSSPAARHSSAFARTSSVAI